jgi:putative hydrolase of the HAD superfamily
VTDRAPLRAVLLDLDDTLYDHSGTSRAAMQVLYGACGALQSRAFDECAAEHARILEELHLLVITGRASVEHMRAERFRRLLAWSGWPPDEPLERELVKQYREAYMARRQIVPGALELLQALRARGMLTVVVSNNMLDEQEAKLRFLGLRELVDLLVVSEVVGVPKPDARIFQAALALAGCGVGQAVMLGDSWQNDIAGARALGMRAVWLNRFGAPHPEPGAVPELRALAPADEVVALLVGQE